mgnify:CR=1 FL=1
MNTEHHCQHCGANWSANVAAEDLKPGVFEFARLLPMTSIQDWWAWRPLRAEKRELDMASGRGWFVRDWGLNS